MLFKGYAHVVVNAVGTNCYARNGQTLFFDFDDAVHALDRLGYDIVRCDVTLEPGGWSKIADVRQRD